MSAEITVFRESLEKLWNDLLALRQYFEFKLDDDKLERLKEFAARVQKILAYKDMRITVKGVVLDGLKEDLYEFSLDVFVQVSVVDSKHIYECEEEIEKMISSV